MALMKSRDTVHLYRGPSSWSLWPTTDKSWRVTREVIYKQEIWAMLVLFANANSSEQLFIFFFPHLAPLTAKSFIVAHWFSHSSACSKPRDTETFSLSTGNERHRLNPSPFVSRVNLDFWSERERQCGEQEQQAWAEHFPNLCPTTRKDFDSLSFILKNLLLTFHKVGCSGASSHHILNRWMYHSIPDKKELDDWEDKAEDCVLEKSRELQGDTFAYKHTSSVLREPLIIHQNSNL